MGCLALFLILYFNAVDNQLASDDEIRLRDEKKGCDYIQC